MGDTPVFKFKNLGLTIEGKNAAIDSNKAFVIVNNEHLLIGISFFINGLDFLSIIGDVYTILSSA